MITNSGDSSSSEIVNELRKLNKISSQICEMLQLIFAKELDSILSDLFSSPEEMKIYELSDGIRSTREIGNAIGIGKDKISDYWRKWEIEGIVISSGKLKPYKAKYSLIELAQIRKRKNIN